MFQAPGKDGRSVEGKVWARVCCHAAGILVKYSALQDTGNPAFVTNSRPKALSGLDGPGTGIGATGGNVFCRTTSREEADLLTLNRKGYIVLLILYRSGPMTPPRGEVLQGTLDLIVLKTLDAMGPLHGYGIAQRIQQVSEDLLKLNQGTLYPALLRLEQRGWVGSKWGVSDNNRKAKYYSLTRAGRKQLANETESWERMAGVIGRLLAGTEGA
jgi:PadR family transcriptional regulator, regulatory protein PadR